MSARCAIRWMVANGYPRSMVSSAAGCMIPAEWWDDPIVYQNPVLRTAPWECLVSPAPSGPLAGASSL
jgi:hypothetical protein